MKRPAEVPVGIQVMQVRQALAGLLIIAAVFLWAQASARGTPAGVSTDCLNDATAKFKTCLDGCKGRSDAFTCCGECDSEFMVTFQNCCNDHCKVDNPPASCSDDSGPGCAGGVVEHPQHPDWCSEETGMAPAPKPTTELAALIVPASCREGQECSGSLVKDREIGSAVPAFNVVEVRLPSRLHKHLELIAVGTNKEKHQPGNQPVTFVMTGNPEGIPFEIVTDRPQERTVVTVRSVKPSWQEESHATMDRPTSLPVLAETGYDIVHWKFTGDARKTRVTVNHAPARILVETPEELIFQPPESLHTGENRVEVTEGKATASFNLVAPSIDLRADQSVLEEGQTTQVHLRVRGLGDMPASDCKPGRPSELSDQHALESIAPGATAQREDGQGKFVLVIRNDSPETAELAGRRGNLAVEQFGLRDLIHGEKRFDYTVRAKRRGKLLFEATLYPELAEVAAIGVVGLSAGARAPQVSGGVAGAAGVSEGPNPPPGIAGGVSKPTPEPLVPGCCQYHNEPRGYWCDDVASDASCLDSLGGRFYEGLKCIGVACRKPPTPTPK